MVAVQVGQEQRHAVGLLGAAALQVGRGLGPGQQQDLLGLQGLGDPHLAAVDPVVVALTLGERGDTRSIKSRTGFGDTETDVQIAVDDPRQRCGLEFVGPVLDHGLHPEDGQVDRAGAVHRRARSRNLLEQQGGLGDAQAVPAVLLRDGHAEPAAVGDGVVELPGELVVLVLLHPVVVVEPAAQLGHRLADQFLILGELETHSAGHILVIPISYVAFCRAVRRAGADVRAGVRTLDCYLAPLISVALAANWANVVPTFSLWLSAWMDTSWPSTDLRSAPTVHCSRGMCW